MKSPLQKKIENIQGLRGIAILLGILFHLLAMDKKFGHGERILSEFFRIGGSGVDLFFVISGFVLIATRREVFHFTHSQAIQELPRRTRSFRPSYPFHSLSAKGASSVNRLGR